MLLEDLMVGTLVVRNGCPWRRPVDVIAGFKCYLKCHWRSPLSRGVTSEWPANENPECIPQVSRYQTLEFASRTRGSLIEVVPSHCCTCAYQCMLVAPPCVWHMRMSRYLPDSGSLWFWRGLPNLNPPPKFPSSALIDNPPNPICINARSVVDVEYRGNHPKHVITPPPRHVNLHVAMSVMMLKMTVVYLGISAYNVMQYDTFTHRCLFYLDLPEIKIIMKHLSLLAASKRNSRTDRDRNLHSKH